MAFIHSQDEFDTHGQKGDWCFVNGDTYMLLQWGDTKDNICMVNVGDKTRRMWQWDGNKESPTLSPSIHVFTGNKTLWHGYLRSGKLEDA